jgi:hypothetical protein
MTDAEPGPSTVDEVLAVYYHASAAATGRADLAKVLDDADAYCAAHPEVMARDRRKLLHARLRVVDRGLRFNIVEAMQAPLFDEPRYLPVGANLRVEHRAVEVTDWDASYGLELDEYLVRVESHQKTTHTYREVRAAWQPGDRLPDVIDRIRQQRGRA